MRIIYMLSAASFILAGCSGMSLSKFDRDQASGVSPGKVSLYLLKDKALDADRISRTPLLQTALKTTPELREAIDKGCSTSSSPTFAAAGLTAAILPAIGKLLFDLQIDRQIRAAEELKSSAQAAYSQSVALTGEDLQATQCALLLRESGDGKAMGSAALVRLVHSPRWPNAFVALPLYVKVNQAVAVTNRGDKNEPAKINMSVGIITKAVGTQQNQLPGLFVTGEGATSVTGVPIGPNASARRCLAVTDCPTSDLITYASKGPVSFALSIAETGQIGINFDQTEAELKAVKEALGPALKTAIEEELK